MAERRNRRSASSRQGGAPTIADVATLAGVSAMTVSRVINGGGSVRPATRQRVKEAIDELKYAPNRAARNLAGASQLRIGLLYANPSVAYLSEFLLGALDEASRSDIHLVVAQCGAGKDTFAGLRQLIDGGVHGIVLPPPLCDSQPILDRLREEQMPTVLVATEHCPDDAAAVWIDDRQAAFDMTRHLQHLGHERIGFIKGNPNLRASERRLAGYREALADAGIAHDRRLEVDGLFSYRSGLDAAETLLAAEDPPSAIFASNDDMAAAAVAVAHRRGLDVPGDLTVCGYDDSALATTIWPELTTIHQPIADMSRTALTLLSSLIRERRGGAGGERNVRLHYTLVRRQSDAAPRRRPLSPRAT